MTDQTAGHRLLARVANRSSKILGCNVIRNSTSVSAGNSYFSVPVDHRAPTAGSRVSDVAAAADCDVGLPPSENRLKTRLNRRELDGFVTVKNL